MLIGGAYGDRIDGGTRRGPDPRRQRPAPAHGRRSTRRTRASASCIGPQLYDGAGVPQLGAAWQANPDGQPSWSDFVITLLDHDLATQAAAGTNFGDDYIAGGAGDDMIFGELGNDTIQGDGSIDARRRHRGRPRATIRRDVGGAGTDGDDYIEGGGGDDLIFGDLGQDDLIGGSSDLFGARHAGAAARRRRQDLRRRRHADRPRRPGRHVRERPRARRRHDPRRQRQHLPRRRRRRSVPDLQLRHYGYSTRPSGHPAGRRPARLHADRRRELRPDTTRRTRPQFHDRSPAPNTNIGGGDFLHGEGGDDIDLRQAGADTIFGDGQATTCLRQRRLRLDLRRHRRRRHPRRRRPADPEPQRLRRAAVRRRRDDAAPDDVWQLDPATRRRAAHLRRPATLRNEADLEPFYVGTTTSSTAASATTSLHGGAGDDAMSGAEALRALLRQRPRPARRARVAGLLHARQRARLRRRHDAVPLLQPERPVPQDHGRAGRSTSCSTSLGADVRRDDAAALVATTARTSSSATSATTGSSAARTRTTSTAATATTCSRPTTTSTRRASTAPSPTRRSRR